jgi:hypothetical protein
MSKTVHLKPDLKTNILDGKKGKKEMDEKVVKMLLE